MSAPTEAGFYWAKVSAAHMPRGWAPIRVVQLDDGLYIGDGRRVSDHAITWGPRIPDPEKLARIVEVYERHCRGIDAAARAGGMPPSLDYKPPGFGF